MSTIEDLSGRGTAMKSDDVPTIKSKAILLVLVAMVLLPILAYLAFLVRW